jgi:hypothetical protein
VVDRCRLLSQKSFQGGQTMEINIPLFNEFSLKIADTSNDQGKYPSASLQKGLLLYHNDLDLTEEGVGLGVPVIKQGIKTIFPGDIELSSQHNDTRWKITALYKLNLEERVGKKGQKPVKIGLIYKIQNSLAAIYRRIPSSRQILTTLSNTIRRVFHWETQYSKSNCKLEVKITYTIQTQTGSIKVNVDIANLSRDLITEVVLMNEQGANYFDRYQDSNGEYLKGKDINAWQEVSAGCAAFLCVAKKVAFSLKQIEGAKLFRGRELVMTRLAWSGFGYSIPLSANEFTYEVKIEMVP